jgi:hypothetical protein
MDLSTARAPIQVVIERDACPPEWIGAADQ